MDLSRWVKFNVFKGMRLKDDYKIEVQDGWLKTKKSNIQGPTSNVWSTYLGWSRIYEADSSWVGNNKV